jgi:hypothetical protein
MDGQVRFDADHDLAIEDLTKQILAAVVDEYAVESGDGTARFRSFKRLSS